MQFISFAVLIKRIKAIKSFMTDPDVPKRKKFLIVFGIIYLLSPIDLIPAPILGFSIIDDLVLWGFILSYLSSELDKYSEQNADGINNIKNAEKKFKNRNVVQSEGRVVEDDETGNDEDESTTL